MEIVLYPAGGDRNTKLKILRLRPEYNHSNLLYMRNDHV